MTICGVEIKGQEAILAVVDADREGSIVHVRCATTKIALGEERNSQSLNVMLQAIRAFANQNKIDLFVIKTRLSKGQMAAGGVTFKIEALFQLSGTEVDFVSPQALAVFSKKNMAGVPRSVLKYQADAFRTGAYQISKGHI